MNTLCFVLLSLTPTDPSLSSVQVDIREEEDGTDLTATSPLALPDHTAYSMNQEPTEQLQTCALSR